MDAFRYLNRLGLKDIEKLDYAALCALQKAHLLKVPYENLDILADIPLKMDRESLYEKIVLRGRGGYCFELNGALGALLSALGFDVVHCMARFLKNEKEIPMRRHRVLKVNCDDGLFLCDAGVGIISPIFPVNLETAEEQKIGGEIYRVDKDDFLGTVIHQCIDGVWDRLFSFTDEPQLDIDFVMPSFYCEKHPDSPFTKGYMIAVLTEYGGKNALNENKLSYWDENGKHKIVLDSDEAIKEALVKYFGLPEDLPVPVIK